MIVAPGSAICDARGLVRGFGTHVDEHGVTLLASTLGAVQRVAKWVAVQPVNSRYSPEVGDIVVGRVAEVGSKRWSIDIGARQFASLPLGGIVLSGGEQRRRTLEDQIAMRGILKEGDLVCAEVHSVMSDGGVMLHARSIQYGKLENGVLVRLPASLVPRQKQHVASLPAPFECDMALGVNGWVFLTGSLGLGSSETEAARSDALAIEDELAEAIELRKRAAAAAPATVPQRRAIAAIRKALQYMAREGVLASFDNCVAGATAILSASADVDVDDVLAAALLGRGAPGAPDAAAAASSDR